MTVFEIGDRLKEGLISAGERINRGFTRLFGSGDERVIQSMGPVVDQINSFEPEMRKLTDAELSRKTDEFKDRLASGETLDDLLPEAFAVAREASRRVVKTPDGFPMRHFDVQLIGGVALHRGMIAEMVTGEGKTLVATLASYLNALTGRGVHIITVNDYLAARDRDWMAPMFEFLGLTAGALQHDQPFTEKKAAYDCDITYGTDHEFGFDYLRDNMAISLEAQVQRDHYFAIIDEVDSVLIDEARTPLIISGPSEESTDKYYIADKVARRLRKDVDFEVKEKEHQVLLTEEGTEKVEQSLGVDSLYKGRNIDWPHHIEQALRAHNLYKKNVDYVVKQGEVIIVDEFTGRLMPGRRWSDGLHQAIEAKEHIKIKEENQTLATITYQNLFKIYEKLAGMTGTAATEAMEFNKIYGLDVAVIPTNKKLIRITYPDVIFRSEKEKYDALEEEIADVHKTGRPILVGTISIERSEMISKRLARRGIPHEVLNARHHEREAQIVAKAGQMGHVTVATNMAGRGTDIVLGQTSPEELLEFWKEQRVVPKEMKIESGVAKKFLRYCEERGFDPPEEVLKCIKSWDNTAETWDGGNHVLGNNVAELGGLHIIGSERHEARRIDNQLRGRSGRQGDPGSSRFFLSLEDDLMRIFAKDWVKNMLDKLGGWEQGMAIESRMVTRGIANAQKKVEEHNFEIRKNLLEYDEAMNEQRKIIYQQRQQVLEDKDLKQMVINMIKNQISLGVERNFDKGMIKNEIRDAVDRHVGGRKIEDLDLEAEEADIPEGEKQLSDLEIENLILWAQDEFGVELPVEEFEGASLDQIKDAIVEAAVEAHDGLKNLLSWIKSKFGVAVSPTNLKNLPPEEIEEKLIEVVTKVYDRREEALGAEQMRMAERFLLLDKIDVKWKDHLHAMDQLKSGIGLRGYAQVDPKVEYKREGYELFEAMINSIEDEVTDLIFKIQVESEDERALSSRWSGGVAQHDEFGGMDQHRQLQQEQQQLEQDRQMAAASDGYEKPKPIVKKTPRVGRNAPCPCGSGKKYKHCCGGQAR